MINRGVKGITLDPANATALVPIVKKAHDAGIVVVTTNTSLQPREAEAAYETDNFQAGILIGQWAKATMGSKPADIALLDYDLSASASQRAIRRSPALRSMWATPRRARPRWRTFYPPIRTSTSSTRSTSLWRKAPTSGSRKPSAMCSSPRSTAATPASTASPTARSARLSCNPRPRGPDAGRGDRQGGQGRSEAKRLPQYRHGSHHGPPGSGPRLEGLQMGLETAGAHDGAGSRTSRSWDGCCHAKDSAHSSRG
jgi:substrate-binding family protein